jgi:hypothetical protein
MFFTTQVHAMGPDFGMDSNRIAERTAYQRQKVNEVWREKFAKISPFAACRNTEFPSGCKEGLLSADETEVLKKAEDMFLIRLHAKILNQVDEKLSTADQRLNCALRTSQNNIITSMDKSANKILLDKIAKSSHRECDNTTLAEFASFQETTQTQLTTLRNLALLSETKIDPASFYGPNGELRIHTFKPKSATLPGLDVDFGAIRQDDERLEEYKKYFMTWHNDASLKARKSDPKELQDYIQEEQKLHKMNHMGTALGTMSGMKASGHVASAGLNHETIDTFASQQVKQVDPRAYIIAKNLREEKVDAGIQKLVMLFENPHLLDYKESDFYRSDKVSYRSTGEALAKHIDRLKNAREKISNPGSFIHLMKNTGVVNQMLENSDNLKRDCEMANHLYARHKGIESGEKQTKTYALMAANMLIGAALSLAASVAAGLLLDRAIVANDVINGMTSEDLVAAFESKDAYRHYADSKNSYESAFSNGVLSAFSFGVGRFVQGKIVKGINDRVEAFADSIHSYKTNAKSTGNFLEATVGDGRLSLTVADVNKINAVQISDSLKDVRAALRNRDLELDDLPIDLKKALGVGEHQFDGEAFTRLADNIREYQNTKADFQVNGNMKNFDAELMMNEIGATKAQGYSKEFLDRFDGLLTFNSPSGTVENLIGATGDPKKNLVSYTSRADEVVDNMMDLKTQLTRGLTDHTSREYLAIEYARRFVDTNAGDAVKAPVKEGAQLMNLNSLEDSGNIIMESRLHFHINK